MSQSLRILIAHNAYQQRGGEDAVVAAEAELLRAHGHEVTLLSRHNDQVADMSRTKLLAETFWSHRSGNEFARLAGAGRVNLVHVHNTFPLLSPSIYWAAAKHGIPVVQTLHNFRLFCPQAMFLREGRVCEDCLGRVPWRSVVHRCYRNSAAQSGVLAGAVTWHHAIGTYRNKVTRYIALNEFCRQKFIQGGLPADRIVVKPNFVDVAPPLPSERDGYLFVGRLSPEKGIAVLADAIQAVPDARLTVAGTGPDAPKLSGIAQVSQLGPLSPSMVLTEMARARALVMPSIWYENFPRTLVEAFASGLPVIASRIGALIELVEDGVTGLLFNPGDSVDLAQKLRWAHQNPDAMAHMGTNALKKYRDNFTANTNYAQLIAIYESAMSATMTSNRRNSAELPS